MEHRTATFEDLRRHHLLDDLDDAQVERVRGTTRIRTLAPGETLFHMGDEAHCFYLVLSGQIKLYRVSPGGQEKVVELIQPDQTFAEAIMFMDRNDYPVSATAIGETRLLVFDSRTFLGILNESHETCLRMLGTISRRLRRHLNEIDSLALQNARLRVVNYLQQQHARQDSDVLHLPAAKKLIAARLSIQPETFSRILHQLTEEGVIEISARDIRILDPDRLDGLAFEDD